MGRRPATLADAATTVPVRRRPGRRPRRRRSRRRGQVARLGRGASRSATRARASSSALAVSWALEGQHQQPPTATQGERGDGRDEQRRAAAAGCPRALSRRPGRAGSPPAARSAGWPAERLVDALPQLADVDLDDVGVAVERRSPRRARGSSPSDSTSPGRRIRNSSSENCRGVSVDGGVAAPDPVRGRVQPQVADLEHRRPLVPAAAQQGPEPGDQHHEGERLGQEVVGAGVERPRLLLGDRPAR